MDRSPPLIPVPTRKPCVVGNWKMHGSQETIAALMRAIQNHAEAILGLEEARSIDLVVCPPMTYLSQVQQLIQRVPDSRLQLGAQNVYHEPEGAVTGEISAPMLVDVGCRYVIIGHSERRRLFGEQDELLAKKVRAAYDAGLTPILCVGETLVERKENNTLRVIESQLNAILTRVPREFFHRMVIAYEPIWAIGTGIPASPNEAQSVHAFIRAQMGQHDEVVAQEMRIVYGGSVKAGSVAPLFEMPDIDGALVGAASLQAEAFLSIGKAAALRSVWNKSF